MLGLELLLFSPFCDGPNVSRGLARAESWASDAPQTRFGVESLAPRLGRAQGHFLRILGQLWPSPNPGDPARELQS